MRHWQSQLGKAPHQELVLRDILAGFSQASTNVPSLDLSTTKTFIIEVGGRARPIWDFRIVAAFFRRLDTLVVHGILSETSEIADNLLLELSNQKSPWVIPRHIRLPDWLSGTWAWGVWNKRIKECNWRMKEREDILWST